jgi:two-component system, chemotaxis family, sensor kinase CheA
MPPPTDVTRSREGAAPADQDGELLLEFVDEASEQLDRAEQALLALERTPKARGQLDAALRSLHSLKGSAGYVSLFDLQALCHGGEELIQRLPELSAPAARERLDLALDAVSIARARLDEVRDCVARGVELADSSKVAECLRKIDTFGKP